MDAKVSTTAEDGRVTKNPAFLCPRNKVAMQAIDKYKESCNEEDSTALFKAMGRFEFSQAWGVYSPEDLVYIPSAERPGRCPFFRAATFSEICQHKGWAVEDKLQQIQWVQGDSNTGTDANTSNNAANNASEVPKHGRYPLKIKTAEGQEVQPVKSKSPSDSRTPGNAWALAQPGTGVAEASSSRQHKSTQNSSNTEDLESTIGTIEVEVKGWVQNHEARRWESDWTRELTYQDAKSMKALLSLEWLDIGTVCVRTNTSCGLCQEIQGFGEKMKYQTLGLWYGRPKCVRYLCSTCWDSCCQGLPEEQGPRRDQWKTFPGSVRGVPVAFSLRGL